jgi:hypothetical protein
VLARNLSFHNLKLINSALYRASGAGSASSQTKSRLRLTKPRRDRSPSCRHVRIYNGR